MVTLQESLDKVERLREVLLINTSDSYFADDAEYRTLRRELLMEAHVNNLLPDFVRKCRNLQDFWSYEGVS